MLSIILIRCYNISNTNNETNKMYDYVIIKWLRLLCNQSLPQLLSIISLASSTVAPMSTKRLTMVRAALSPSHIFSKHLRLAEEVGDWSLSKRFITALCIWSLLLPWSIVTTAAADLISSLKLMGEWERLLRYHQLLLFVATDWAGATILESSSWVTQVGKCEFVLWGDWNLLIRASLQISAIDLITPSSFFSS